MATASTAYGQFNPSAVDPYPIETKLAELATTSPASAQTMLDTYRLQRQAAGSQYTDQLEQQRQFAHQQLAATIAKNQADTALGFVKEPGGLEYASNNPQFSNVVAGMDPNVVGHLIGQQTRLQNATIAEKGGAGLLSTTNAGFQPNAANASAVTGGLAGPQGDPVTTANAKIAAAAKLGAASIGAANRKGPVSQMPMKFTDEAGNQYSINVPVPLNATPAQVEAIRQQATRNAGQFYPQGTGTPGAVGPGAVAGDDSGDSTYAGPQPRQGAGPAGRGAPTVPATQTNVPRAPASGGTTRDYTGTAASGAAIKDPKVQAQAQIALRDQTLFSSAARSQILANAPGGQLTLVPTTDGSIGFVGKDKKVYTLPPPPAKRQ